MTLDFNYIKDFICSQPCHLDPTKKREWIAADVQWSTVPTTLHNRAFISLAAAHNLDSRKFGGEVIWYHKMKDVMRTYLYNLKNKS